MDISYSKLEGSLSSGIMVEEASSNWLTLKHLDISFDYDEESNIISFSKILAEDGVFNLPSSSRKNRRSPKIERKSPEAEGFDKDKDQNQELEALPDIRIEKMNLSNLTFKSRKIYKLHKLQIKDFFLSEKQIDIKKFALRTENIRIILKKAAEKLHFIGWHREKSNLPKQKVKLVLSEQEDGKKQAILNSTWFDAAIYYANLDHKFEIKYIRRLDKNNLKLPPISKFKFDFNLDEGEFYIGEHRYESKLNLDSGIIFENSDTSFPLYLDIDGLKFGLNHGTLTAQDLGKLWFGRAKLTNSEEAYLSNYIIENKD
ncbi:MAG: hypothetical protein AB8G05_14495 [Oligoflexales bacterium]